MPRLAFAWGVSAAFCAVVFSTFAEMGVGIVFNNALQATELGALVQTNQGDALCGAAHFADFSNAGTHHYAGVGD